MEYLAMSASVSEQSTMPIVGLSPSRVSAHHTYECTYHLTNVLMRDLFGFQVNQDKAFQNVIVEDQIDVIILFLGANVLLPCNESVTLTKFHQEFL